VELLVATRNAGKMKEIRRILASFHDCEVLGLEEVGIDYHPREEDLETFETFEENALSKANYFSGLTGLITVADDSGISVDALAGAPGVRSRRFALDGGSASYDLDGQALDDANNRHLIENLRGVPSKGRTARYVCLAALVESENLKPRFFRGEAPGVIVDIPAGSNGFGYDPHVFCEELGRTYAQMTPEEKDARSHRGIAFREVALYLAKKV
tara:strand:+ start:1100 stop:1738 length:639 start_codon:yes stop_codon:yes gene_type:complete